VSIFIQNMVLRCPAFSWLPLLYCHIVLFLKVTWDTQLLSILETQYLGLKIV
jgi:hypothetical protein